VRIGVVSDIHCNAAALETALDMMASRVDEVFVAGDVLYEYRFSNEVVGSIHRGGFPYVLGNHEMVFLGQGGERARSAAAIDQDSLRYLAGRPTRIDCRIGGRSITMVHGSPWAPYNNYLTENDPLWDRCSELDSEILITGHTHVPMVKSVGRTLIVNPGSLGESREAGARDLVSYALIDLSSDEVEIVRFPNPRL
jgi:putative phosphoesterase